MTPDDLAAETAQLRLDEGFRALPYVDTEGVETVFYGHNLRVPMSKAAGEVQLQQDIGAALAAIRSQLPYWDRLDGVRQRVLLNMSFNLGSRLLGFHKMLEAVKVGDWDEAADQMLASVWAGQVGERAKRLAHAMRTGVL